MRAYHSCYITSLPCSSLHTAQPLGEQCPRREYLIPGTRYHGAGKKSWCRVTQFSHVDVLCGLCSCVIAVLHTHTSSTTRAHGPTSPPTQPHSRENPPAVSSPEVSRLRELKHVSQTRCISLSPSGSATPHVPWRYFPQTLHGWFVKSGGPGA